MNRYKVICAVFFSAFFLIISCEKDEEIINNPEEVVLNVSQNDLIHEYMWRGMNLFYLWQDKVPDLADTRFTFNTDLYDYYSSYNSPSDMFTSMLYQFGTTDKYSWVVDDYIALENSFQGNNFSNGMEFGLVGYANNGNNVFGYVRYVVPNSDAALKNVSRGMIFSEVNGTQITDSNFRTLLLNENSYTISLANFNSGNPTSNGTTISLTKTDISENPIYISKVITEGSHKIGYLMYNQFASSYDGQLNATFAQFKAEGITDLVIDLRYNGGGRTSSAKWLGGMITGQFTNQVFSRDRWNSKVLEALPSENFVDNFSDEILNRDSNNNVILQEPINSLQLNDIYFITTSSSASASELIINNLKPYINVRTIGDTTEGKVHGSITLYDSDDFSRNGDNLNSSHFWAMQPLVAEFVNKDGQNSPDGIIPTIRLREDFGNLGKLGERSDPLLNRAIVLISTGKSSSITKKNTLKLEEIGSSKMDLPSFNNMYIDRK